MHSWPRPLTKSPVSLCISSPAEPEDRNREQNKVPTQQEEVVSELLCYPDVHKSRQMPSFCWELVKQPTKLQSPSFISSPGELESSWVTGGWPM